MSIEQESTYQYLGEFSKILDKMEEKNQTIMELTAQVIKLKQKLKENEEEAKGYQQPFRPVQQTNGQVQSQHPFK
jgi:hypothetical protein